MNFPALQFKRLMATLLPVSLIWVSIACVSICLNCCADEEIDCAIVLTNDCCAAEFTPITDCCQCPVPEQPKYALQKSVSYEQQGIVNGQALTPDNLMFSISSKKLIVQQDLPEISASPPVRQTYSLRI
jgi:hypothetical protein